MTMGNISANTHALRAHSNSLQRDLTACERDLTMCERVLSDARRVATELGQLLIAEKARCRRLEAANGRLRQQRTHPKLELELTA